MTSATKPSVRAALREDVGNRINRLQEGYLDRRGPAAQAAAQGDLAQLRAADPADPLRHPGAWPIVQDGSPEVLSPAKGPDEPTAAEAARHCALVLYALHQQGKDQPAHRPKVRFAQAVRQLGSKRAQGGEETDPSVRHRFDQAMLAATLAGRAEHLKALVRLMRGEDLGFDYCRLAADLYDMATPDGARLVRLTWARDLYRRSDTGDPTTTASPTDPEGDLS